MSANSMLQAYTRALSLGALGLLCAITAVSTASAQDRIQANSSSGDITSGDSTAVQSSSADSRRGEANRSAHYPSISGAAVPQLIPPSFGRAAARRPLPDLNDSITLTPTQQQTIVMVRNRYRETLRAFVSHWQPQNLRTRRDTAVFADSVQHLLLAGATAILAVLTPQQRAQYDRNVKRLRAVYTPVPQPPRHLPNTLHRSNSSPGSRKQQ